MNKYVVAYFQYSNSELTQELVSANSKLEAAKSYLQDFSNYTSLTDMQNQLSDSGAGELNVLELKAEKQRAFSLGAIFAPLH
jgi:hypothetical protein